MKRHSVAFLVVVALVMIGCNSSPDVAPAEAPPLIDTNALPAVILPSGDRIVVEVAADGQTRARGLMFRDRIEPGQGMLFLFPSTEVYSFWMKNTLVPLDMIWIDEAGKVVHVKAGVPPCKADPCPSYSPGVDARYVLELGSGQAAAKGIDEGDVLRFANLASFVPR